MDKRSKTEISAADLYVLLNRELRRRQHGACASCEMPLPFRVENPEADRANWEVIPPSFCAKGCSDIAESIIADFARLYDLRPAAGGA